MVGKFKKLGVIVAIEAHQKEVNYLAYQNEMVDFDDLSTARF